MELFLEEMCFEKDIETCLDVWEEDYTGWQKELNNLKNSEEVNFVNLPFTEKYITQIKEWWEKNRGRFKYYVNLGIGGSSLGGKALVRSFTPLHRWESFGEDGGYFFMENVDPQDMKILLEKIPLEETLFNVISKSGTTVETMSQLMIIWEILEKKNLLTTNLIFTTDPVQGELVSIANDYGIKRFEIPPQVGGRFSVLSPVGLIPAIVAGIDADKLLEGAREVVEKTLSSEPSSNPSFIFAGINYNGWQMGRNIVVLMTYASPLNFWGDWFVQLWAESIGKNNGRIGVGSTPLRCVGVTDQHSILQLFLDGPRDKIIYFLGVKKRDEDVSIPSIFREREKISYLGGHTLSELMKVEREATIKALKEKNIPAGLIELESISPKSIGRMIMFFELSIFYAGKMFNINPFNQPAVEEIKKYIYGSLGRKGYEDYS